MLKYFLEKMAEVEGFEPPREFPRLSVFKTDPFSRTWVNLRFKKIMTNNDMVDPVGLEPTTDRL